MATLTIEGCRPAQPPLIFLRRWSIIEPTRPQPEPAPSLDREALNAAALAYLDGRLSIIPVDARKKPALKEWAPFQKKPATREQVKEWGRKNSVAGFAVVCGEVSGGLTILDFDVPGFYERWAVLAEELALILPTQRTGGGGEQVAFRSGLIVVNDKLAWAPADNTMARETAIETRGEGGYAVLPPSFCHLAEKRGKRHQHPYKVIQGDFAAIPTITDNQAHHLIEVARSLCQAPLSKKQMQSAPLSPKSNGGPRRSGVIGAFNEFYEVGAILSRNGYQLRGDRYLAPDSTSGLPGVYIFEDTGRCYSHHANDPLNDGHSHDAFSVFCTLEHGGDVKAAVKAAAAELGIERGQDRSQPPPVDDGQDYDRQEREAIQEETQAETASEASTKGTCSDQIAQLNQKHAVVMLGGKCVVMNETVEPIFNRPDINFSSTADFKTCYANRMVEVPKEKGTTLEPLGKIWITSPLRRQYDGIVFAPGQDIPGFYNLFRGLAVKPAKGDWSLMRHHNQEVIATGNEEVCKYLLAWMGRLVQDPGGERPGTSVVMRGPQGAGKGCFASQYGEIFGSHFLHITNPTHLVHRFNQHLKDALLVFVDEGIWAGDKTAEGILKGMVTEKYFMCEPKGKDAFPVKNHVHLIIASNSQWVVPAGLEERRFMVLDVSDKYIQDKEYFEAIFHQMDQGGREAMLYDLLEMDISGVDLRTIPRTGALLDQISYTMSTAHKFWFERLRAGTLLDHHREWEVYIITEALHQAYLEFADACGERYRLINSQFSKELRRLCPDMKRKHLTINAKQTWVLTVPDLETCRQQFEKIVKVKVNWEGDVDEDDLPF
jgi:hypothetical protein